MKTICLTAIIILVSFFVSCKKQTAQRTNNAAKYFSENSSITTDSFYIGENYGGGIVFYIDSTGQHGLIAALQNVSDSIVWYNNEYLTTGATGLTIGTGKSNTKKNSKSSGPWKLRCIFMC